MARRHLLRNLSGEERSLQEIWAWHELQIELVDAEATHILNQSLIGLGPAHPRYFAKTREELITFFDKHRWETNYTAILGMLAATEAALRVDFLVRVINKKKDKILKNLTRFIESKSKELG